MKAFPLFCLLALLTLQGRSQSSTLTTNPLVGTWIETTDSLEEVKIISPTHVFFFVRNIKRDTFAYAGAGAYTIANDKYTEQLQHANFEVQGGKVAYTYKVQGDKFTQKGVLIIGDGTKENINHTFNRVNDDKSYNGTHVGTWNQLSSSFTLSDGTKTSHTNATHIRYQIITPTHWMRISKANGQFENAFGGNYTIEGDKMIMKIDYTSVPAWKGATVDITQRIEGNKLYLKGVGMDASGKEMIQFEDVFEKVGGQSITTAAK